MVEMAPSRQRPVVLCYSPANVLLFLRRMSSARRAANGATPVSRRVAFAYTKTLDLNSQPGEHSSLSFSFLDFGSGEGAAVIGNDCRLLPPFLPLFFFLFQTLAYDFVLCFLQVQHDEDAITAAPWSSIAASSNEHLAAVDAPILRLLQQFRFNYEGESSLISGWR